MCLSHMNVVVTYECVCHTDIPDMLLEAAAAIGMLASVGLFYHIPGLFYHIPGLFYHIPGLFRYVIGLF